SPSFFVACFGGVFCAPPSSVPAGASVTSARLSPHRQARLVTRGEGERIAFIRPRAAGEGTKTRLARLRAGVLRRIGEHDRCLDLALRDSPIRFEQRGLAIGRHERKAVTLVEADRPGGRR